MKLRKGEKVIDYYCRHPDGSLKITTIPRHIAFCHRCQFDHMARGCVFAPSPSNGAAFGEYASAKPAPTRREFPA